MNESAASSSHANRKRFDVAICGGGIMGSSIAYFLSANSDFRGSVAVVEKDSTYLNCSTTRSVGSIRQQFSTEENIRLSQFGFEFLSDVANRLQVGGQPLDIGLIRSTYLMLSKTENLPEHQANHALQLRCGAKIERVAPDDLRREYPWLNSSDLAAAFRSLEGEGWFDPHALLMGLRAKAIAEGVSYLDDEVVSVGHRGERVSSISLASGSEVDCGALVNAAGPYAGRVSAKLGIDLPVGPRKRNVFVIKCQERIERMPLVIDPAGVYVRPEGEFYVSGWSPSNEDPDESSFSLEVDYRQFDDILWPLLAHRIPAFSSIKMASAWAGHYDYNDFDQNGFVGAHPEISNFYFCNGFSGHGLQQAPGAGRALSELLTYGEFRTIDLRNFGYERLRDSKPVREKIVI